MAAVAQSRKRKVDFADHGKVLKKSAMVSSSSNNAAKKSKTPSDVKGVTPVVNGHDKSIVTEKSAPSDVLERRQALSVQIVTGDYERVTHGFAVRIDSALLEDANETSKHEKSAVEIAETFLFTAHTASIRCLAISPVAENSKRYLATGSTDERINLYSISTRAPVKSESDKGTTTLNGSAIAENLDNRSLGSLLHHDRAVNRLSFPAKGKLFSAAEDNTVAISRTRDWTIMSSIKAPLAKVQGRPSGDTAAPGEVPAGVNDFAIHPSQKLMLTVSRGEKCMRLWNLMTGNKAGVLSFDRALLTQAGEGKHSSGEGRRLLWDDAGESYVVGFERSAAWFGVDSQPRAILKPQRPTKFHQYRFLSGNNLPDSVSILAVSTENGKVLLFDLGNAPSSDKGDALPTIAPFACIGNDINRDTVRIKDFEVLYIDERYSSSPQWLIVTAGSDGSVKLWSVIASTVLKLCSEQSTTWFQAVGKLIAQRKIESRITCLGAFILDGCEPESETRKVDQNESVVEKSDDDESDEE